ncbi:MAG: aminotransferase class I/II-fold pyridoxal phosphate-dependent enzyme [Gemmatimonadetes bacterium]|nr:aminotransferase class I/II-fold pyridoxal phosphate-dependent enzyme [Gemmatimonadota bacterium]
MTRREKNHWRDLAVAGAMPRFREPLHVGLPNLPDRGNFHSRIDAALDRRRLTNDGPLVRELETSLARHLRVRHCVVVANGTLALSLALRAAAVRGEVILPSFTFIATAHAVEWQNMTPVFCDVDPATHNIDPARIEERITDRTSAILGVHVWGRPCAVDAIETIAKKRGLVVLYDAAHAFSCSTNGTMIGNFGAMEAFSFHATKFFHTLEGGAVTTNDNALAATVRKMRDFGYDENDDVVTLGTNAKLNEIGAGMGLALLDDLDRILDVNRANYRAYERELAGISGVRLITHNDTERSNYQYIVLEVDGSDAALDRDELLAVLKAENVLARRYFDPPCHECEPYRSRKEMARGRLEHTDRLSRRLLCLPTGERVDDDTIRAIGGIVRTSMQHAGAIRKALAR